MTGRRRCTRSRGCASRAPRTAPAAPASSRPSAPRPTGKVTSLELARKLLEHGADPNVRVDWQEIKFEPLGGTTRNPPGLFLGRHLLTYNGATAFYVAAKNGDHEYMRLLAEGGADPIDHEPLRRHAADGRRGPRYLGRRDAGPHTGYRKPSGSKAVALAIELGNDINAAADFGDFAMTGEPEYTLLYYPHNLRELQELGMGDPRWSGSTALHGSIISNQPSIVQYLVDHGANIDAKTETGWTALMMTRGVFLANTGRLFPAAEAILMKAPRNATRARPRTSAGASFRAGCRQPSFF